MHKAYKLIDSNTNEVDGYLWWDGKKIQSTNVTLLSFIKKQQIPIGKKDKTQLQYSDGEQFFDALSLLFRTGYEVLKKTKVNDKGEEKGDEA